MNLFRACLIVFLAVLLVYTGLVIRDHGWNFLYYFFRDLASMNWAGQFNLDFAGYLLLSALWVSWRHRFSAPGLALGVVAFFLGMGFLGVYVLYLTWRTQGDVVRMLTGERAPATV